VSYSAEGITQENTATRPMYILDGFGDLDA
jgi:hypothetical protein